jgi:uncharacterized repeat protein (TIGR03803 family)
MRFKISSASLRKFACAAILVAFAAVTSTAAFSQSETVLADFANTDYGDPYSGLIADGAGNFYGTLLGTTSTIPYGMVYELQRGSGGTYNFVALHYFSGPDGYGPDGGLVRDSHGNLYGTTIAGGNYNGGVVYELQPTSSGTWDFADLYNFHYDGVTYFDGAQPIASMIVDKNGNLYGTTNYGGNGQCYDNSGASRYPYLPLVGCGIVFELSQGHNGAWAEKILYNFQGGTDGALPSAGLTLDHKGNLYGTTTYGGMGNSGCINTLNIGGCGVVFSLTRGTGGKWMQSTLYEFQGQNDGSNPTSSLVFDHAGNLYGTTTGAGLGYFAASTVFELSPSASGSWTKNTIFAFSGDGSNTGLAPLAGVVFDKAGNLYGTTYYGNGPASSSYHTAPPPKIGGYGVVFKLTPSAGTWTQSILYSFNGSDGMYPNYGNLLLLNGALYGATSGGGAAGVGTIYKVAP